MSPSTSLTATLGLIAALSERRPPPSSSARLDALFLQLARVTTEHEALQTEDCIWWLWMADPNAAAAAVLDRATTDIAYRRFDIAETRLVKLLRTRPDYSEAWHKLATLHYLLGRDDESLVECHHSLELEPRHFGALCTIGEILFGAGEREGARLAFRAALRLHPHHVGANVRLSELEPH